MEKEKKEMEISNDPYELKLYQMFQSCDRNQCGLLDEDSLHHLCKLLELNDPHVLIKNLTANNIKQRISFERFKEALLHFLGTELDKNTPTIISKTSPTSLSINERSLIISDEVDPYIDSPIESSDREVSPKLIVGTKKYGRRSRPHATNFEDNSQTDSNSEVYENERNNSLDSSINNKIVIRSSSQTDIPGNRKCRPTAINSGSKLKRCSSLPSQKNNKPIIINRAKMSTSVNSPSVMNKSAQFSAEEALRCKALNSSVESLSGPTIGYIETLKAQNIIDIWERAHISNGRGILLSLGFDEEEINLNQLNKVFEEELRSSMLEEDTQTCFFRAAYALQSAELSAFRQTFRQLRDENLKLRADNKDANQRLAMLAVEIDERHASLEDSSKKEIRTLEQRHASALRDLTTRMATDRENWANLTSKLEDRIKQFEQEQIKWKSDVDVLRKENSEMETEQQSLQSQITELLEKNIQLNSELTAIEDVGQIRESRDEKECEIIDEATCDRESILITKDEQEIIHLVDKVEVLQLENANLRDKNDELAEEIDTLKFELMKQKSRNKINSIFNTTADDSAVATFDEESEEDICVKASPAFSATKRLTNSPKTAIEICNVKPQLEKVHNSATVSSPKLSEIDHDKSDDWVALDSELKHSGLTKSKSQVEALQKRISELEDKLAAVPTKASIPPTEERMRELENSLEQMQRAYEDCEDYWQSKLSEERQLFEKERQIYEDEQQESDKKFTELMEKVREYEEQFSKDGRLSPIEEKYTLEQQYEDLEAEAAEIRENSNRLFKEKCEEIEELQREIEDLRLRLGESVEILTGASELNAEELSSAQITGQSQSASSPISYLWQQSTIQDPVKHYLTTDNSSAVPTLVSLPSPRNHADRNNLSTSETAIFSTTPINISSISGETTTSSQPLSPIQKPSGNTSISSKALESEGDAADCDTSSTASGRDSFETHSISSAHGLATKRAHMPDKSNCASPSPTPSGMKEELKRLKCFELSLKDQIKDLTLQRDGLVMELQQLHEARPVLEKAYARTAHPSLIQRVQQLELRNRHLQNVIKQQQNYTESIMQQSWQHHQIELSDLHGRIEAQGALISEQVQRLQNADVLVKELYVENSHLTATVQQLKQHQTRTNFIQQQQHFHHGLSNIPNLQNLPGMP